VFYDFSAVSVNATFLDGAVVQLNDGAWLSLSSAVSCPPLLLDVGPNVLRVVGLWHTEVSPPYVFSLYRLSNDSSLRHFECAIPLQPFVWDPLWAVPWQPDSYDGYSAVVAPNTLTFPCRPMRGPSRLGYGSMQYRNAAVTGGPFTSLANATWFAWPLASGRNLFELIVTAEDPLYTASYHFLIHRISGDSSLRNLNCDGGTLAPPFAPFVLVYTIVVPAAVATVSFTTTFNCQLRSAAFANFLAMHWFLTDVLIVCVCVCLCVCVCVCL
jgi:hypothetical protein